MRGKKIVRFDLVSGVGSNFESLTLSTLFQVHLSRAQFGQKKKILVKINSIPCAQQSLGCDYIETLCKGTSDKFHKGKFYR